MLRADLLAPLIQEAHIACHRGFGAIGKDLLPLLALGPAPLLHRLVPRGKGQPVRIQAISSVGHGSSPQAHPGHKARKAESEPFLGPWPQPQTHMGCCRASRGAGAAPGWAPWAPLSGIL